jgi:hypothetical protein
VGDFATAVIAGFIGAFIGYLLRAKEFRRDQRLKIYGELVSTMLAVSRTGAVLQGLYFEFGDMTHLQRDLALAEYQAKEDPRQRERVERIATGLALYREAWERHEPTRSAFEEATARSRLLASRRVARACGTVERWVAANVHGVPPFNREFDDHATSARQGPAVMEKEATVTANNFARAARRDVIGGLLPRPKPQATD